MHARTREGDPGPERSLDVVVLWIVSTIRTSARVAPAHLISTIDVILLDDLDGCSPADASYARVHSGRGLFAGRVEHAIAGGGGGRLGNQGGLADARLTIEQHDIINSDQLLNAAHLRCLMVWSFVVRLFRHASCSTTRHGDPCSRSAVEVQEDWRDLVQKTGATSYVRSTV